MVQWLPSPSHILKYQTKHEDLRRPNKARNAATLQCSLFQEFTMSKMHGPDSLCLAPIFNIFNSNEFPTAWDTSVPVWNFKHPEPQTLQIHFGYTLDTLYHAKHICASPLAMFGTFWPFCRRGTMRSTTGSAQRRSAKELSIAKIIVPRSSTSKLTSQWLSLSLCLIYHLYHLYMPYIFYSSQKPSVQNHPCCLLRSDLELMFWDLFCVYSLWTRLSCFEGMNKHTGKQTWKSSGRTPGQCWHRTCPGTSNSCHTEIEVFNFRHAPLLSMHYFDFAFWRNYLYKETASHKDKNRSFRKACNSCLRKSHPKAELLRSDSPSLSSLGRLA